MSNDVRKTSLARIAAVGLLVSSIAACTSAAPVRDASYPPMAGSSLDVVGAGGPQDDLARQIYHPGTGTDW